MTPIEDIEKLERLLRAAYPNLSVSLVADWKEMLRDIEAYKQIAADLTEEIDAARKAAGKFDTSDKFGMDSLAIIIERLRGEIERLTNERDEAYEALEKIKTWSEAYPLDIFPEPDFKKAHEVLKSNGMTLDSISASNMRHVLNGMIHIVQRALKAKETKQ